MRKTIIVIDDDPDDTDLILTAVEEIDPSVNCLAFNYCDQAIAYLKDSNNKTPDFIILDMNMPRMSGKECLVKIRSMEHNATVPVIINSTTIIPKDKVELKTLGASFIFTKTNQFEKLVQILSFILSGEWRNSNELEH
jgi:DNA-binding response OmpR family regulator